MRLVEVAFSRELSICSGHMPYFLAKCKTQDKRNTEQLRGFSTSQGFFFFKHFHSHIYIYLMLDDDQFTATFAKCEHYGFSERSIPWKPEKPITASQYATFSELFWNTLLRSTLRVQFCTMPALPALPVLEQLQCGFTPQRPYTGNLSQRRTHKNTKERSRGL